MTMPEMSKNNGSQTLEPIATAHKVNNTIGQALLAKHSGKSRIIAETGAGQHGVATATMLRV